MYAWRISIRRRVRQPVAVGTTGYLGFCKNPRSFDVTFADDTRALAEGSRQVLSNVSSSLCSVMDADGKISDGSRRRIMGKTSFTQSEALDEGRVGVDAVEEINSSKVGGDAFALAKEKSPAIIFIDELDAVGARRHDSDSAGGREVQRTMLELLN